MNITTPYFDYKNKHNPEKLNIHLDTALIKHHINYMLLYFINKEVELASFKLLQPNNLSTIFTINNIYNQYLIQYLIITH